MITFTCPHCGRGVSASEDQVGQEIPCPGCKRSLFVEEGAGTAPPAEQEARVGNVTGAGLASESRYAALGPQDRLASLEGLFRSMRVIHFYVVASLILSALCVLLLTLERFSVDLLSLFEVDLRLSQRILGLLPLGSFVLYLPLYLALLSVVLNGGRLVAHLLASGAVETPRGDKGI